jgi:alanine racemase
MSDWGPRALIDHAALRHNLARVAAAAPGRHIWAVIKSDAYGHGIRQVAETLDRADGFAVARVEEAVRLREGGTRHPLLVLGGFFDQKELMAASRHRLDIAVHQDYQLRLLESTPLPRPLRAWLKVDTGMGRLGFHLQEAREAARRLAVCRGCAGAPRWMTHLADADDLTDPLTPEQARVLLALAEPGEELSIANSAGVLGWPETHGDWVRPGIMLYGVSPFLNEVGSKRGLLPVMTLEARLIARRNLRRGDRVGYGGSYVCPQDMPAGVVAIGYGDGYPRHARSGTPVLVNGARVPVIGRVSMDLLILDLRGHPQVSVGDPVVLWGRGLPVEEVATMAETIGYELLTGVTRRVRVEHRNRARATDV